MDIFKSYRKISLPDDEVRLADKVLSAKDDKGLFEFYSFHLALNAEKITARFIEENLDNPLRPLFRKAYNRAYLLLKVWKSLVEVYFKKTISLPNLYLPQDAETDPYYYYRKLLGVNQRSMEKRWKEILFHLSPT